MYLYIIILTFLINSYIYSANYFVDQNNPSANDDNVGNVKDLPWKTLAKAISTASAGDSVFVMEGTYIDYNASSTHPYPSFNPLSSGTALNPIVFISDSLHQAVIKAKNYLGDGGSGGYMAWGLEQINNIVIDGFKIIGGFRAYKCSSITIKNVELIGGFYPPSDPSLNWGIAFEHTSSSLIQNNFVHNMLDSGNHLHNCACFMIFGDSDNNILEYNSADVNNKIAYAAYGQKGGSMDNNIWRYNFGYNGTTGFLGMGSTDGMAFSTANTYYQNIIINCDFFMELDHNSIDFLIYNNTSYNVKRFLQANEDNNRRSILFNNVTYSTEIGYVRWNGYPGPLPFDSLFKYSDYNIIYGSYATFAFREKSPTLSYSSIQNWSSESGFDINSVNDDPGFINPGGTSPNDYKRHSYPQNGRGGSYPSVQGAYISGNEIIGYSGTLIKAPKKPANFDFEVRRKKGN